MKNAMMMLLAFCVWASTAFARSWVPVPCPLPERSCGVVRLEVVGDSSGVFPIHSTGCERIDDWRGGTGVIHVSRGERYRLRVTNQTGRRIGLAIAVDGLNILDGSHSHGRPSEALYILSPWQTGDFSGWRTSNREVRRFYFTDSENSYASDRGEYGRIGQVSVSVYFEEEPEPPIEYLNPSSRDKMSGRPLSPSVRSESQQPGTGWGERDYSPVRSTHFDPESSPAAQYTIRYEWARRWYDHHRPSSRDGGYCPPPSRSSYRR